MSDVKFYFQFLKLGALLLFCFGVGGALIYNGVAGKKGPVTFDDVYPGVSAIAAGLLLIGWLYWMSRPPREEPPVGSTADTGADR